MNDTMTEETTELEAQQETTTPAGVATVPPRVEALREAAILINSDRDAQYGHPTANFARIADILNVVFDKKLITPITPEDVAMMMVCVKVGRYAADSGFQPDTWIDIAGYAGCGYEVGKDALSQEVSV